MFQNISACPNSIKHGSSWSTVTIDTIDIHVQCVENFGLSSILANYVIILVVFTLSSMSKICILTKVLVTRELSQAAYYFSNDEAVQLEKY